MSGIHAGSGSAPGIGASSGASTSVLPAAALASRKLTFHASLPLLVELADPPASETTPIAQYYCKVPRISYLPLLLPTLRKYFLESLLDEAALLTLKEDQMWFEFNGQALRWHWPVGLLYDVHTANTAESSVGGALAQIGRPASSASSPGRQQLESYFSPPTAAAPPSGTGAAHLHSPAHHHRSSHLPWRIKLHLKAPPSDKLNMSPSVEACRTNFMSMVKEADFVRFGTTRRVVNLRRTEQDALWEGVVEHDFEKYWSVASRLLPPLTASSAAATVEPSSILDNGFHALSISPSRTPSLVPSIASSSAASSSLNVNRQSGFTTTEGGTVKGSTSPYATSPAVGAAAASQSSFSVATGSQAHSEASSVLGDVTVTATGGGAGQGSAAVAPGGLRHIPMRIHLPDGLPVVQEPVAPYFDDGRPKTLFAQLSALFPLLFPPAPSFASFSAPSPPLAFVVVQGVRVPLEAEIAWLGAVLGGADGWLSVIVLLNPES
ncbi:autophagy protein 5 [Tilletia horrida]|nr:autophagy protein 5 [Tilletia horrida]